MVANLRVLGLRISENGHNEETIRLLENSVHQTSRLIKRIANKNYGMKEHNLVRLVQACVVRRNVYVASYLKLHAAKQSKIYCIIKKAYKQAIGLPLNI